MPCIVNFKTKKEFKTAINNNELILMENPSIFEPYCGILQDYFQNNVTETFTNHPKRSWFASVTKNKGNLIVK